MVTKMTMAEQLARMPSHGERYELIEGVLTMMSPAGGRHGRIAGCVFKLLANHVDDQQLGCADTAATGFLISTDPDTVRAPDAAFVSQDILDSLEDDSGFLPFAPTLAL